MANFISRTSEEDVAVGAVGAVGAVAAGAAVEGRELAATFIIVAGATVKYIEFRSGGV